MGAMQPDKRIYKGIILAGGRSVRFGSNKAHAVWKGKTLLKRAWEALEASGCDPVVITREDADDITLSFPSVRKDILNDRGPLGGLYSAMKYYPNDILVVLTCDMPSVPDSLITRLIRNHTPG